jgi:hypothetical protein
MTLALLILMLAGSANMQPDAFQRHKTNMWLTAIAGFLTTTIAILLVIRGHPAWAATIGALPAVIVITLLIFASAS